MKFIHTILAACLICTGCISLHRDTTTAVLLRTIIPRLDFRQAIAADVVAFFQASYEEFRQPEDPDLRFVAQAELRSMIVGGPQMDDTGAELIGEGRAADATLWEEMQRFAENAEVSIEVDGTTIRFKRENESANQAVPIAASAAQADR